MEVITLQGWGHRGGATPSPMRAPFPPECDRPASRDYRRRKDGCSPDLPPDGRYRIARRISPVVAIGPVHPSREPLQRGLLNRCYLLSGIQPTVPYRGGETGSDPTSPATIGTDTLTVEVEPWPRTALSIEPTCVSFLYFTTWRPISELTPLILAFVKIHFVLA